MSDDNEPLPRDYFEKMYLTRYGKPRMNNYSSQDKVAAYSQEIIEWINGKRSAEDVLDELFGEERAAEIADDLESRQLDRLGDGLRKAGNVWDQPIAEGIFLPLDHPDRAAVVSDNRLFIKVPRKRRT